MRKQVINLKPGTINKITKLSFAGERIFCGIDVHKLSWRVNIRSEEFELEDYSQQAQEEVLLSRFEKITLMLNLNWYMKRVLVDLVYNEVYKAKGLIVW